MKKVFFNVLSLIVLIVFTGIFGCKKEQKIPHENGYYLPTNITHFPSEEGELKNVHIYHDTTNIDSLKLIFSGAKPTYKANDILVGTEGSGYLVKVTSEPIVRGDTLIIKTALAKFTEAFEDAYIDTVIQVKPQEKMKMNLKAVDTIYTATVKGKNYNIHLKYDTPLFFPGKSTKSEKYGFCWTFPNIKIEIKNPANNTSFSLSADTLIVSKDLSIDFKLDLEWFQIKRVRLVKIENEGFRFVGLSLKGEPIDNDFSIPLLDIPVLAAIPVGPIVLTVGFKIKLGSEVHIGAEAKWDCVVSYDQHTEVGGDWYDDTWHNVYEKNITPILTLNDILPAVSGYIKVDAPYIDVIGDISLYSVIGPEFYIRPFLYFNLDIPSSMSQVNYEYGAAVKGGVKLALTLFDIPIINFTLAEYRMKLGEGTYTPNNPPDIPVTPSGPANGGVNFTYNFTSSTTDPDGDSVAIRFDWGDGDTSLWSNYVASGDSVSMDHSYADTGTYLVKAQAKDVNEAVSDWSTALSFKVNKVQQIIFVSGNADSTTWEIYAQDYENAVRRQITQNNYEDYNPIFTPDGSKIIFVSDEDGDKEIMEMNSDGTGRVKLTDNTYSDFQPAISPDGTKIAFVSNRDGNDEIYEMNLSDLSVKRLTNNSARDWSPTYSPDGSKIAFISDRDGDWEIYTLTLSDLNVQPLTNDTLDEGNPAYSPDGAKIAFTLGNTDGTNREIYIMNADGTGLQNLSNNSAEDFDPSFSPDGSKIIFTTNRDGNYEIYEMDVNGDYQHNLTNSSTNEFDASWYYLNAKKI